MNSILKYCFITAFRDLLFLGMFGIVLISTLVSSFLGNTALTEQDQMSLVYMAGSLRMIINVGLILFVCFHVKRLFDSKEIEVILSRSISRVTFILSYWLGFTMLALISVLISCLIIFVNNPDHQGLFYWSLSIVTECSLIVAFSFLASLILESAVAATMVTFCFYVLSRMMGYFVASLKLSFVPDWNNLFYWCSQWILKAISIIVPRLDQFAKTNWLVYGIEKDMDFWFVFAQSAIYIPFILCIAIIDFRRKQF